VQTADEESLAQNISRSLSSNRSISLVVQISPSEHSRKHLRTNLVDQNTMARSFTNNAPLSEMFFLFFLIRVRAVAASLQEDPFHVQISFALDDIGRGRAESGFAGCHP
jgi:hypothetical protein